MSRIINDEDIKGVMDSLNIDIPEEVDRKINTMIRDEIKSSASFRSFSTRLNPFIKWSPAFAAAILLIIIGSAQLYRNSTEQDPVKEIRIEYEIKDKNIKILWVKKEGFLLKRRKK